MPGRRARRMRAARRLDRGIDRIEQSDICAALCGYPRLLGDMMPSSFGRFIRPRLCQNGQTNRVNARCQVVIGASRSFRPQAENPDVVGGAAPQRGCVIKEPLCRSGAQSQGTTETQPPRPTRQPEDLAPDNTTSHLLCFHPSQHHKPRPSISLSIRSASSIDISPFSLSFPHSLFETCCCGEPPERACPP